MFLIEFKAVYPYTVSWISDHVHNQKTDQSSKVTHWLSTESGDNIKKLHKSMTRRPTCLAHGGMDDQLYSKNNIDVRNHVEARSSFNQLKFHALIVFLPDVLTSHQELKYNLNINYYSEEFSLS